VKRSQYYCDICGKEIPRSTGEKGYLAKRVSSSRGNINLEIAVYINGWSGPLDICHECGDEVLQRSKKKLAFEIVGER
jgi:hypothetical protein